MLAQLKEEGVRAIGAPRVFEETFEFEQYIRLVSRIKLLGVYALFEFP